MFRVLLTEITESCHSFLHSEMRIWSETNLDCFPVRRTCAAGKGRIGEGRKVMEKWNLLRMNLGQNVAKLYDIPITHSFSNK